MRTFSLKNMAVRGSARQQTAGAAVRFRKSQPSSRICHCVVDEYHYYWFWSSEKTGPLDRQLASTQLGEFLADTRKQRPWDQSSSSVFVACWDSPGSGLYASSCRRHFFAVLVRGMGMQTNRRLWWAGIDGSPVQAIWRPAKGTIRRLCRGRPFSFSKTIILGWRPWLNSNGLKALKSFRPSPQHCGPNYTGAGDFQSCRVLRLRLSSVGNHHHHHHRYHHANFLQVLGIHTFSSFHCRYPSHITHDLKT